MTMKQLEQITVKSKGGGSIINTSPLFSPDGQCLFIIWKNLILSYNVETGEKIAEFEGCDGNIIGAGLHPTNSMLLVACSVTGEIVMWKWQAQLLLSKNKIEAPTIYNFQLLHSNTSNVCEALIYSSDLNHNKLSVISLKDYKTVRELPTKLNNHVISIQVGGSADDQFVAIITNNELLCTKTNSASEVLKFKQKNKRFTCLTCHPSELCVATGDSQGRVVIWRNFGTHKPSTSVCHWHTLPVNVLAFSESGTYLYSGGNECVLVKWRLTDLEKKFLPRLPAPIVHLSRSDSNTFLAVATKNNAIHILDAQFFVKRVIQHLTWAVSRTAGIKVDYRSKSLVLNGNIGNIQFYSPHNKQLLYNLDVVGQNKLTQERNVNVPNTNVSKLALSKLGNWLACVEERTDDEKFHEIRLKFFKFEDTNQSFCLNTSIEFPHEKGINCLEFQPNTNSNDLLCATSGDDNRFKIWSLIDVPNIYRKTKAWRCSSSTSYKSFPSGPVSFSMDGSLISVGFAHCLTVWSSDTSELKCSLAHAQYKSTLRHLLMGNADQSHRVVTATEFTVCVWDLLTLSLVWTVPLRVEHLCMDPLSAYMAAFTPTGLYIFTPESSTPVYAQKHFSHDKEIVAVAFAPRITENMGRISWLRLSQLYFINKDQELMCVDSSLDVTEDRSLEYTKTTQSPFGSILAQTKSSTVQQSRNVIHSDTSVVGATDIKQFIQPPVHTMAPVSLLCNTVLRSFVQRDYLTKNAEQTMIDEDSENEVEKESDDEVIGIKIKKNSKGSTDKKKRKGNLRHILEERFDWNKLLIE